MAKYLIFYENEYDRNQVVEIEPTPLSDLEAPTVSDFQYKLENQTIEISVKATDLKSKVTFVAVAYMIYKSDVGTGGYYELHYSKEDNLWKTTFNLSKGDKIIFGGSFSVGDNLENFATREVPEYTIIIH